MFGKVSNLGLYGQGPAAGLCTIMPSCTKIKASAQKLTQEFFRPKMDRDQLTEVLSKLYALRDNLPEGEVEEKYVDEFHAILTELSSITDYNLSEFYIPRQK